MAEVSYAGPGRRWGFLVSVFGREHNRLSYTVGEPLQCFLEQMQQGSGETQPWRQKGWYLGPGIPEEGMRTDPIKQNGRMHHLNNYSILYGFRIVRFHKYFSLKEAERCRLCRGSHTAQGFSGTQSGLLLAQQQPEQKAEWGVLHVPGGPGEGASHMLTLWPPASTAVISRPETVCSASLSPEQHLPHTPDIRD